MEAAVFEGNRKDCAIVSVEIQGLGKSCTALMHRLLFPLLSLYFSPVTHTRRALMHHQQRLGYDPA